MTNRYAIIVAGVVENVVLWDGESMCDEIPEDAIQLPANSPVGPGYAYEGGNFVAPPDPPPFPNLP